MLDVITKNKPFAKLMLIIVGFAIIYFSCVDKKNVRKANKTIESNVWKQFPMDSELEKVFKDERNSFDRVVSMSNEDYRVVRIAYDFTWLDNDVSFPRPEDKLGFSRERWDEYKSLFNKIKLKEGIIRGEDEVYFIAYSAGLVTGGIEKGYIYSKVGGCALVNSLDNKNISPDKKLVCKKIDENWYLYLL